MAVDRWRLIKSPINKKHRRYVEQGVDTDIKLFEGDIEWMTNDYESVEEMRRLAAMSLPGHVLVGGLGLGILLRFLAEKDDITCISVIEKNQAVIDMITDLPPLTTVIRDDFNEFIKGDLSMFDCALVDIWHDYTKEEMRQMKQLSIPSFVWGIDV